MSRATRKIEHLNYALKTGQTNNHGFKDVHFVHQALPETSFDKIDITSSVGGLNLGSPIIINAMTGGAEETEIINEKLAVVARETGLAIAVGSQMAAIKQKKFSSTYNVMRKIYRDGVILANLGAEANIRQAQEAIDMIEANALQIHLNVIQELVMPEGDRSFEGTLDRIAEIKQSIKVPLIVKEVGFGLSTEAAIKLREIGVRVIDVGGKGGTNFALIENKRRVEPLPFFENWGIKTAVSILEVANVDQLEIIASGGIQNANDVAKALGLGASATGMSGKILHTLMNNDVNKTIDFIQNIHNQLKLIMTGVGAKCIKDLKHKPMIITGEVKEWCDLRGIPIKKIARRA